MEEKSRAQELSVREISLIRELAQIRKEHKRENWSTKSSMAMNFRRAPSFPC